MKKLIFILLPILIMQIAAQNKTGQADTDKAQNVPETPAGRDAAWQPTAPPENPQPPVIKKLKEGLFQVGRVTVDKNDGSVSAEGEVNMQEGLVEYLACGSIGKLHESVLVIHAQPYHLQIALLLLGLEPGDNQLERQGDSRVPQGDPVEIWVSWRSADHKEFRVRAEDLIFNIKEKKPMPRIHWVYTGSQIIDGRYIAQIEQSIIATYHDPYAMFDHPLATGGDDTLYYANQHILPPKGTPVTLIIKPAPKEKSDNQ